MRRWGLAGFIITGFIAGTVPAVARANSSARDVVLEFLRLDHEGYRLGSKGHEAIWALTNGDGEPPAWPVQVAQDYRIVSAPKEGDSGRVVVEVRVDGTVVDGAKGPQFRKQSQTRRYEIDVSCHPDCVIDISFEKFHMPPLPGPKAVDSWLGVLEGLQKDPVAASRIQEARRAVTAASQ
jgi:hypothetical protein